MRLSVFDRNMLQGSYLGVNRGNGNRIGWNSIIGSFVISKLQINAKVMGKNEVRGCNYH